MNKKKKQKKQKSKLTTFKSVIQKEIRKSYWNLSFSTMILKNAKKKKKKKKKKKTTVHFHQT